MYFLRLIGVIEAKIYQHDKIKFRLKVEFSKRKRVNNTALFTFHDESIREYSRFLARKATTQKNHKNYLFLAEILD